MRRHLTGDAHEWMNEIPNAPIYCLAETTALERACDDHREGLVELDSGPTGEMTQNWMCVSVRLCGGGEGEECVCLCGVDFPKQQI